MKYQFADASIVLVGTCDTADAGKKGFRLSQGCDGSENSLQECHGPIVADSTCHCSAFVTIICQMTGKSKNQHSYVTVVDVEGEYFPQNKK